MLLLASPLASDRQPAGLDVDIEDADDSDLGAPQAKAECQKQDRYITRRASPVLLLPGSIEHFRYAVSLGPLVSR